MNLYKVNNGKVIKRTPISFSTEKEMQSLLEDNLETIFNLQLIASEFSLNSLRIDTLAYDVENNSFVILEYKKDQNSSVIDQGYAYLNTVLNHKSAIVQAYQKKLKVMSEETDFDWSQTRMYFVARAFTKYQKLAASYEDKIELWKIDKYGDDLFSVSKNEQDANLDAGSIPTLLDKKEYSSVQQELKTYTVDDHFENKNSRPLYNELVTLLANDFEDLDVQPRKLYIGFQIDGNNVFSVAALKDSLKLTLTRTQPSDVNDPEKKLQLRTNSLKNFNQNLSDMEIRDENDLKYAMNLIEQAYNNYVGK